HCPAFTACPIRVCSRCTCWCTLRHSMSCHVSPVGEAAPVSALAGNGSYVYRLSAVAIRFSTAICFASLNGCPNSLGLSRPDGSWLVCTPGDVGRHRNPYPAYY